MKNKKRCVDFRKYSHPCIPEFPHKDGWLGGMQMFLLPLMIRKACIFLAIQVQIFLKLFKIQKFILLK